MVRGFEANLRLDYNPIGLFCQVWGLKEPVPTLEKNKTAAPNKGRQFVVKR